MKLELSNLPLSWMKTNLGEFVTSEKGKKPKHQSSVKTNDFNIPYVDIMAFEQGQIGSFTNGEGCRMCYKDDLLMVWDGSRSGLVGKGMNGALGSTLVRINFPGLNNDYAFYFLKSKYLQINSRAKGSGTPHVDPDLLWNYEFPIPPLPEQHRIVAKLEELFSELDNGIANLKKAQAQLKVYRQAVLKAAFEGKLTEQWRAASPDATPDAADKLLEQIKAERQRLSKKPKEYPPLTEAELKELPALPVGWKWVRLGIISQATGGYAFKSADFKESGRFQVVKIGNVKMGELLLDSNSSFIDEVDNQIVNKYSLQAGDCIITLTGTRKKRDYGYVAMVAKEKHLLLNQRLALLRFFHPLLPGFFQYALRSDHFQNNFFKHETGNVGQGNVGMGAITEEVIMLPPIEEQHQIVQEIESRLSVCDHLEQEIDKALRQSEALRQSILKKAFEGRLVPQDPGDEPAGELLKRIKNANRV